jgi:hypothetical protein
MQRLLPVANGSFMEAQLQRFSDLPAVIHDGWLRAQTGHSPDFGECPLRLQTGLLRGNPWVTEIGLDRPDVSVPKAAKLDSNGNDH